MSRETNGDVEFRAIREEEREACLVLWNTVFPHAGADFFPRYFYGDVEWLPYYTQVAVVEGRIVSAVHICNRKVACGEFDLTMGGIANVATLPEFRGRGYSSKLLQNAVAVMEADAMDFSLLFTGIPDHYARIGYEVLPRPALVGTASPNVATAEGADSLRPATEEDLPALRSLYDVLNHTRPIAVKRYEAYWREWIGLAPEHDLSGLYVMGKPGGEDFGYIHLTEPGAESTEPVRIREIGATHSKAQNTLLRFAADRALAISSGALRLIVPLSPALLESVAEVTAGRFHQEAVTGSMVRVLHRTNLLQSLTLMLTERWMAAGRPSGVLTFATPYGPTRLDANGSFLRVTAQDGACDALPQSMLLGLLFGLLTPEQTTDDVGLHPLLAALFPTQEFVWWPNDGF